MLHTVQSVIIETDVIKRDAHILLAQINFSGDKDAEEKVTFIVKEWGT